MKIKRGDYGYVIPATVVKADFTTFNLVTYTVKMKVWIKGTPSIIKWTLDGTIIDAVNGKVEFLVAVTHFTEVGEFRGEIELIRSGHIESTKSFAVTVEESPT